MELFVADKNSCRLQLKNLRRNLSNSRKNQASKIAVKSLKYLCQNVGLVLSFASFASEINIWQFNLHLLNEKRLILPRLSKNELSIHLVESLDQLELHPFGMMQPCSKSPLVDLRQIKIALVPGLGFDKNARSRIGYGKGHYDRFLHHSKEVQLWGIGFHEQHLPNLPLDHFDVPMHRIFLF
jgi:5-formyltetrahydrofolate cyclo-ligase